MRTNRQHLPGNASFREAAQRKDMPPERRRSAGYVPYGSEDPSNRFWYPDGQPRETTVTCWSCRQVNQLRLIEEKLWCRFCLGERDFLTASPPLGTL